MYLVILQEISQSVDVSNSPELKLNQRLLQACKKYLMQQILKVNSPCITCKEPNRVSFVEDAPVQTFKQQENSQSTLGVQKFTLIKQGSVEECSSDVVWRSNIVTLSRCVRDFLAPSCYWNKHWKLTRDDLITLFEFSFVALRVCR